ncbi:MAG: thiamine pyrophosphate-dependent enzyme [Pirellulaceae bacterium]
MDGLLKESTAQRWMDGTAALAVLARLRTTELVVTTMGATREWSRLTDSPWDLHYLPSAMGHAPMLGLGLALARPERSVIVLNGDGSQLMSLGCLVTIAASGATNLTLVVLDNGVYEVTGGQATPGRIAGVDFALIARGAGFPTAATFDDISAWEQQAGTCLAGPGPRLIALHVSPVTQDVVPRVTISLPERLRRLRTRLNA